MVVNRSARISSRSAAKIMYLMSVYYLIVAGDAANTFYNQGRVPRTKKRLRNTDLEGQFILLMLQVSLFLLKKIIAAVVSG